MRDKLKDTLINSSFRANRWCDPESSVSKIKVLLDSGFRRSDIKGMNQRFFKLLALAILGLCFSGIVIADHDQRKTVFLDEHERVTILNQMHYYIEGVTRITEALSKGDMKTVAKVARARGRAMPKRVPTEVKKQLPKGFTDIGKTVHQAFDQMALDAEGFGDVEQSLQQLGGVLKRCQACHAVYQIRSTTYDPMDNMK